MTSVEIKQDGQGPGLEELALQQFSMRVHEHTPNMVTLAPSEMVVRPVYMKTCQCWCCFDLPVLQRLIQNNTRVQVALLVLVHEHNVLLTTVETEMQREEMGSSQVAKNERRQLSALHLRLEMAYSFLRVELDHINEKLVWLHHLHDHDLLQQH